MRELGSTEAPIQNLEGRHIPAEISPEANTRTAHEDDPTGCGRIGAIPLLKGPDFRLEEGGIPLGGRDRRAQRIECETRREEQASSHSRDSVQHLPASRSHSPNSQQQSRSSRGRARHRESRLYRCEGPDQLKKFSETRIPRETGSDALMPGKSPRKSDSRGPFQRETGGRRSGGQKRGDIRSTLPGAAIEHPG
jgi:hypothetical protein